MIKNKKALISGCVGQDGSYLSELLLSKDYKVYGLIRRSSVDTTERISHIKGNKNFELIEGDVTDATCMSRIISGIQPDEIYNLAAMSHVGVSFDQPVNTYNVNAIGPLNILEAIRQFSSSSKFYQACHDMKTKIITKDGIKYYDDVLIGDSVYTINETTGEVEVKKVVDKFIYDYNGPMIKLKGRRIDQLITPNHNVLLRDDDNTIIREIAENIKSLLPHNRVSKYSIPVASHCFNESYISEVKLSDIALNCFADNCSVNLIDKVNAESFYYLLGLYIGDGYFASKSKNIVKYRRKSLCHTIQPVRQRDGDGKFISDIRHKNIESNNNSSYILFAIPEPDPARNKLIKCLKNLGLDFRCKKITVELSCSSLASVFNLCGNKCKQKNIPDFVFEMPIHLQQRVFDGLIDSDGHRKKDSPTQYFATVSHKLAVDFMRLCANIGKICSYNFSKPNVKEICGHKIKPSKNYTFTIAKKTTNKIYPYNISDISYSGKVWCLFIEDNNNFMISRNGKLAFSGNSTSELFGDTEISPQNENTPFNPNSPYAVAKLSAHHLVGLYRRAYDIFACAGILFNHETVAGFMPMFCKNTDESSFDIRPICEIVEFDETQKKYQSKKVSGLQVWGKGGWVDVTYASAYPHDINNDNKKPRFINARCGAFMATSSHVAFLESGEKRTGDIEIGDEISPIDLPKLSDLGNTVSEDEARLLGLMVSDGSISYAKKGIGVYGKFTNSSASIRKQFDVLWKNVTKGETRYYPSKSGFNPDVIVGQLSLNGGSDWLRKIDIYNKDKTKRVPRSILNSSRNIMLAFLDGYNIGDGLKSNRCTYKFRNFKTNSATLAMGLWYLINQTSNQEINITLEERNGKIYYSLNILSDKNNLSKEIKVLELVGQNVSQRGIFRDTGISRTFIRKIQNGGHGCYKHHFSKPNKCVKKILELPEYNGWFYDLETSSGEFHCGIGLCNVHNSPRRGEDFVTRKITKYVAVLKRFIELNGRAPRMDYVDSTTIEELSCGKSSRILASCEIAPLALGNIEAKRDWSHAQDMVYGMWLMMQQSKPDDYVLGSGKTHTVKEFLRLAFDFIGLDYHDYVTIDPKFYRPVDVNLLHSDPSKAKRVLGWESSVSLRELIDGMISHDYDLIKGARI